MSKFITVEADLLRAQHGFIIHGCNDKGVMGSGVAAGVKARFPEAWKVYSEAAQANQLQIGTCTYSPVSNDLWIVNAVTQTLGGPNPLSYGGLASCFKHTLNFMAALETARGLPYGSIPLLFPMIGAGRAGGDWSVISALIDSTLEDAEAAFGALRKAVLYVVKAEPIDCR